MPISLEKLATQAPTLVSLAKEARTSLDSHGLDGHRAKVALCLDYSGSMQGLYRSGEVQALAERVLALATQIDDDGAIDVFAFESRAHYLGELTITDFAGGVDRLTRSLRWGSTDYAGALSLVRSHYAPASGGGMLSRFRKAPAADRLPAYVMFVTDGAPDSRAAAAREVTAASGDPLFWQFLGIGAGPFDFLRHLDDLDGRQVDNCGFFETSDLARLSDQDLYGRMLAEYPAWVAEAHRRGWIG